MVRSYVWGPLAALHAAKPILRDHPNSKPPPFKGHVALSHLGRIDSTRRGHATPIFTVQMVKCYAVTINRISVGLCVCMCLFVHIHE